MTKRTKKKAVEVKKPAPETMPDDLGSALYGVGKEIGGLGEELWYLREIEKVAEQLNHLVSLDKIADAIAAHTLAQYGTPEDREMVLARLRRWFDEY